MANLTEHMMINKWDDDINSAITHVGGDTYGSEGLPDYADIIRSQLVSNDAVGKGVYQDFLYTDKDNQVSIYPWEGEPTTSTNAVQSTVVANAIKSLYDSMATTERFTVLMVDEFPTTEINLSAIYLVKAKCDCDGCPEGCDCKKNTYIGCYYVKRGKELVRIDIPEFKYDLSELFYLTRDEYDAGLSDYVKAIEDLLRKKFGKYWDDEGFTLDKAVEEIKSDLSATAQRIIEETNAKVSAALAEVEEKISNAETRLDDKFNTLESEVESDINALETRITTVESNVTEKFEELDNSFNEFNEQLTTDINAKFDTLKGEVDADVDALEERMSGVETRITTVESNVTEKFEELDNSFNEFNEQLTTDINAKFDTLKGEVNANIDALDNRVGNAEELVAELGGRVDSVESRVQQAEENINIKFEELDSKFEDFSAATIAEVNVKFDEFAEEVNANNAEFKAEVEGNIEELNQKIDSNYDSINETLQEYIKFENLVSLDNEIDELK